MKLSTGIRPHAVGVWVGLLVLGGAVFASSVPAQASKAPNSKAPNESTSPATGFARPSRHEVSSPAVLRAYLRTKDEVRQTRHARQVNHFCFVKQAPRAEVEGDTANLWMVWHEGQEILNSAGHGAVSGDEAESLGRAEALAKSVNLRTDVVETADQISGSSYLVERAWVQRITGACKTSGLTVTVAPSSTKRR